MSVLHNTEGDILEGSMRHYSKLFMNMVLQGDFSHGFTWSIGGKNRPRQINLDNLSETKMSPSDLGVIAIAVSLGAQNTIQERLAHQYFLVNLGIINNDDLEDHARHFIEVTRPEHMTSVYFRHVIESAGKITVLRRAYEQLNFEKQWGRLKSLEDRILLGYVVSVLSGRYEIRPYMVDQEMTHQESWVEYYDQLFDDFSQKNFEVYNEEGFGRIWIDFLDLRNDIAVKKGMPEKSIRMPYQVIESGIQEAANILINRIR